MTTMREDNAAASSPPDGPRWPRSKAIYPTSLRRYLECPYRVRLEYIDRIPIEPAAWDPVLEKGNAVHKIMETIAGHLKRNRPIPDYIRKMVERLLPAAEYAFAAQRQQDIEDVLAWSRSAYRYLRRQPTTILVIEHFKPQRMVGTTFAGIQVGAKADIVVRREDRSGPYIEIIDYKTGRNREFLGHTPILSRIALRDVLKREIPGTQYPRSVFTYLWLESGEGQHIELDEAFLLHQWADVSRQLGDLLDEQSWPPSPSHRCRWCPYYRKACTPDLSGT